MESVFLLHMCISVEQRTDWTTSYKALKQDMVNYFPKKLLLLRVGIVEPITRGKGGTGAHMEAERKQNTW